MPEHLNAGTPECLNTGMPEHRDAGTPEYHFHFEGKLKNKIHKEFFI
jgi:hypothetical protein